MTEKLSHNEVTEKLSQSIEKDIVTTECIEVAGFELSPEIHPHNEEMKGYINPHKEEIQVAGYFILRPEYCFSGYLKLLPASTCTFMLLSKFVAGSTISEVKTLSKLCNLNFKENALCGIRSVCNLFRLVPTQVPRIISNFCLCPTLIIETTDRWLQDCVAEFLTTMEPIMLRWKKRERNSQLLI